jgi:hypothetical protein
MNKTKRTKEKKEKKEKKTTCYHCLLHNTTIREGDDITAITFFGAKSLKKATIINVAIFCYKAIEEGDESCRLLLLLYNTAIEEGDNSKLSSFYSLQ